MPFRLICFVFCYLAEPCRKPTIPRTRRTEPLLLHLMPRSGGQRQNYAMNFPNSKSLQIARFCLIYEVYSLNIIIRMEILLWMLKKDPNRNTMPFMKWERNHNVICFLLQNSLYILPWIEHPHPAWLVVFKMKPLYAQIIIHYLYNLLICLE